MSVYEARLQRDLDQIHELVTTLSERVEQSLENAVQVVFSGNEELAYRTVLGDAAANRLSRELDRRCHAFVALHLPSAGHLRRISSTLRVNLQLERIGDYAVTISREAMQLSSRPEGTVARELEMVANDVRRMLHQSVAAFKDGNGEVARATMHLADDAEHTMDQLYDDLMSQDAGGPSLKELVAIFAIYGVLKRVWDQAKNICEETVFAVFGETKPAKTYKVLFVDEDNSALGPMAEAIGRKNFSERAIYASGGRAPAERLDPSMVAFMESHGLDLTQVKPVALDPKPERLSDYFVIVSLQGPVKSYIPKVPFHTSGLFWDVGSPPSGLGESETRQRYEELYREMTVQLRDLADLLAGEIT
jgi:phosphate transport system protein